MFWDYDALGYITTGFTTLFAAQAMSGSRFERWPKRALLANALVTPLIDIVYFYPHFSTALLGVGFLWAITAPLSMLMLTIALRWRQGVGRNGRRGPNGHRRAQAQASSEGEFPVA